MQKIKFSLVLLVLQFVFFQFFGQQYTGRIIDDSTGKVIAYANIGVVHKSIGTVSDFNGNYSIEISEQFDADSIRISCIGYYPCVLKVIDFKTQEQRDIYLKPQIFAIEEVQVKPRLFEQKTLGVTTKSKMAQAGFEENQLGYECGILFQSKKSTIIETIHLNVARCTYDTVFYRVNIYKSSGNMEFENVLQQPIYIHLTQKEIQDEIIIDLKNHHLTLTGDFLITLEHVKDLGPGILYFCAGFSNKTYFRKTSQAMWEKVPVGISLSIEARVEK